MPSIDWKLREAMPHLRDSGRLNVLMALILHANVRNRCWPSMERLCKETGYAMEAVNAAKKWLIEQKAIEMVPYKHRVGKERELPARQGVYQLTGSLAIAGTVYPYLYISPTEISDSEISPTEREVVKSFKSKESSKTKKKEEELPFVAVATASEIPTTWPDSQVFPVEGKTEETSAPAENLEMGNADKETTTPTPQPPSRSRSGKAGKKGSDAPKIDHTERIAALSACGFAPPLTRSDFSNYKSKINTLAEANIGPDLYAEYVKWLAPQLGKYKVTLNSLTTNNRPSEFAAYWVTKADEIRQQKEAEARLYAQNPHLIAPDAPVEYASPEEIRALIAAAMKPPTREEHAS